MCFDGGIVVTIWVLNKVMSLSPASGMAVNFPFPEVY